MKTIYRAVALSLVALSLAGEHAAMGQDVPLPNTDPDQLCAIVQAGAQKDSTNAVEVWLVGDKEVLTTALGNSMTPLVRKPYP
jgi:hypothetical protein